MLFKKEMRCAACGYVRAVLEEDIEEVVYFKSGKRKGEIKGSQNRTVRLEVGYADFEEISLYRGVDDFAVTDNDSYHYSSYGCNSNKNRISLYACPECKTVKVVE